jgi:hypothetical protein
MQTDVNLEEMPEPARVFAPVPPPRSPLILLLGAYSALTTAMVVVLAIALAGRSGGPAPMAASSAPRTNAAATLTISGSLLLRDVKSAANNCVGTGGYDDIVEGAQVVVTDGANAVVGVSRLLAATKSGIECEYGFTVSDVPAGRGSYAVEVSHRGKVTFKEDDLHRAIGLSLGDD